MPLPHATQHQGPVIVGLRPEHLTLTEAPVTFNVHPTLIESLGSEKYIYFDIEGARIADGEDGKTKGLIARVSHTGNLPRNEQLRLGFDPAQLYLFDANTGDRL
jgi:multiple sugar transport system ATP-binding protein